MELENRVKPLTPEEALQLYPKTGVILLINSPKGISIGLDNQEWQVTDRFRGFKLVPPGMHYLHYTLSEEKHMFRVGLCLWVVPGQIVVKEWSPEADTFLDMLDTDKKDSTFSSPGYCESVRNLDLDPFLGPYCQEGKALWKESTYFVTEDLVNKLVPKNKLIGNTLMENRLEEERQKAIEETINKLAGDEEEVKGTAARPEKPPTSSDAMQEEQVDRELDRKELPKPRGLESFSGSRK